MSVNAEQVKELRNLSGAGMMDCKKALMESDGDLDKAHEYLRKVGVVKASKKSGRETLEGLVAESVLGEGAALVEVNCETDFVARTDQFQDWIRNLAVLAVKTNPPDLEALLSQKLSGETVREALTKLIATLGENMTVRRFAVVRAGPGEVVASYLHTGAKIGAMVRCQGKIGVAALKEVAMHVAAMNPQFLDRSQVPEAVVERERDVFKAQPDLKGKPGEIQEKIITGKLGRFYKEVCLVDQPFVKDASGKKSVQSFLKEQDPKAQLVEMVRFQVGGLIDGEQSAKV